MSVHLSSFAFLSILSALVSLTASIATWRRSAPGSSALSLLLLSMAIWAGGYATRWMEIAGEAKLFWFGVMFIGAATVPTLFLVFTLGLTHNGYWLTPRRLILLSIQPVSTLLLQWTNQYHHIFYLSLDIAEKNASTVMEMTRGPWYFVHIVYSYAVIAIGFFVMNQGAQRLG